MSFLLISGSGSSEHQSVKCNSLEFDSFIPWWWQNKYHLHSMTELKLTIFLFYLLIQPFGHSWSWQYAGCLTLYDLVKAYFTFVFSVAKLEGLRFYWWWRLWSFVCLMQKMNIVLITLHVCNWSEWQWIVFSNMCSCISNIILFPDEDIAICSSLPLNFNM